VRQSAVRKSGEEEGGRRLIVVWASNLTALGLSFLQTDRLSFELQQHNIYQHKNVQWSDLNLITSQNALCAVSTWLGNFGPNIFCSYFHKRVALYCGSSELHPCVALYIILACSSCGKGGLRNAVWLPMI
jgi:hypothetical protein